MGSYALKMYHVSKYRNVVCYKTIRQWPEEAESCSPLTCAIKRKMKGVLAEPQEQKSLSVAVMGPKPTN